MRRFARRIAILGMLVALLRLNKGGKDHGDVKFHRAGLEKDNCPSIVTCTVRIVHDSPRGYEIKNYISVHEYAFVLQTTWT